MTKRDKRTKWNECLTCGERVAPGDGMVVYPLPPEMRIKMPVTAALYTQGVKHKSCPFPPDTVVPLGDTIEDAD